MPTRWRRSTAMTGAAVAFIDTPRPALVPCPVCEAVWAATCPTAHIRAGVVLGDPHHQTCEDEADNGRAEQAYLRATVDAQRRIEQVIGD